MTALSLKPPPQFRSFTIELIKPPFMQWHCGQGTPPSGGGMGQRTVEGGCGLRPPEFESCHAHLLAGVFQQVLNSQGLCRFICVMGAAVRCRRSCWEGSARSRMSRVVAAGTLASSRSSSVILPGLRGSALSPALQETKGFTTCHLGEWGLDAGLLAPSLCPAVMGHGAHQTLDCGDRAGLPSGRSHCRSSCVGEGRRKETPQKHTPCPLPMH